MASHAGLGQTRIDTSVSLLSERGRTSPHRRAKRLSSRSETSPRLRNMCSGDAPSVTTHGSSDRSHSGIGRLLFECPLGEMNIIGPRAIGGHRRQTRIERFPQKGAASAPPFSEPSTGRRRILRAHARIVLDTRKAEDRSWSALGKGAPLETRSCGYGLRVAPRSRFTRESLLIANGKEERPARVARNGFLEIHELSKGPRRNPSPGPARALGTRREERGASNTAQ